MDERLKRIRESERRSHEEIYTDEKLYATDSWLKKPIKTVRDIVPLFADYEKLRVLDLGCGVGRNSIYVAECFKDKDCVVDCVDLLEIAIEKLLENAGERGVATSIRGIQKSIEEYSIEADSYDFIMAISALEHIDTEESFAKKLVEIRDGLRERGVVCLVMNSEVREQNKDTGEMVDAQFEVNISTEKMQEYLREAFEGWSVLKTTVSAQEYDIPREGFVSRLNTNVVTFVARKIRGAIMKTLIFNGSPRANGDTESLLRVVRENIEGEYKVVNAYRCDISACVDCRYCWNEAGCAIQDEMQEVYDYIQECDNILIASPVYFSELTGKLLDVGSRLQTYFCAKFFRKEEPIAKEKRGGVILVGGGDGHLGKAYETACTLLHHVNCHDIHSLVSSHNTNVRPAIEDGVALEGINSILKFFAEKSEG